MRGFRGSRAAQNDWSHRFGKNQTAKSSNDYSAQGTQPQNQARQTPLPEWMKTPETRAIEARQTPPQPLKVIQGGQSVKSSVAPVVVKAKATPKKVVAAAKVAKPVKVAKTKTVVAKTKKATTTTRRAAPRKAA